jgi:hypothetical protein
VLFGGWATGVEESGWEGLTGSYGAFSGRSRERILSFLTTDSLPKIFDNDFVVKLSAPMPQTSAAQPEIQSKICRRRQNQLY